MPLGTELGLGPCDTVSDGDPAAPTERGTAAPSHFTAHVYCGQTAAGWIRIPLGAEVGLGPGNIVSDGTQTPLPHGKGHSSFMWFPPYFYFRFGRRR